MTVEKCTNWLEKFQQAVNKLLESDNLQFTMEVWMPGYFEKQKKKFSKEKKKKEEMEKLLTQEMEN